VANRYEIIAFIDRIIDWSIAADHHHLHHHTSIISPSIGSASVAGA